MGESLSDDEQRVFFDLLVRVCEHHVDQFLDLKIKTDHPTWYAQSDEQQTHVHIGAGQR